MKLEKSCEDCGMNDWIYNPDGRYWGCSGCPRIRNGSGKEKCMAHGLEPVKFGQKNWVYIDCPECVKGEMLWKEELKNERPSDKKCTICGSPCVWLMTHERIEVLQCTKHKNHQSIFGFTV